jgi:four helix bundle protein
MDNQDKIGNLRARIRFFVINTIRLTAKLSKDETGKVLLRQLIRSCTSIGANFEESTEAESTNDIIHKLSIVKKDSAGT